MVVFPCGCDWLNVVLENKKTSVVLLSIYFHTLGTKWKRRQCFNSFKFCVF